MIIGDLGAYGETPPHLPCLLPLFVFGASKPVKAMDTLQRFCPKGVALTARGPQAPLHAMSVRIIAN
jgi:hypothetical protein